MILIERGKGCPALRLQLANGGAFHQYQPLTKRGNNDVGSDLMTTRIGWS